MFDVLRIMENANFYYYFPLCDFLCIPFVFYIKPYTVLNEVSLFIAILNIYSQLGLFLYSFHYLMWCCSTWLHCSLKYNGNTYWKILQKGHRQIFYKNEEKKRKVNNHRREVYSLWLKKRKSCNEIKIEDLMRLIKV